MVKNDKCNCSTGIKLEVCKKIRRLKVLVNLQYHVRSKADRASFIYRTEPKLKTKNEVAERSLNASAPPPPTPTPN